MSMEYKEAIERQGGAQLPRTVGASICGGGGEWKCWIWNSDKRWWGRSREHIVDGMETEEIVEGAGASLSWNGGFEGGMVEVQECQEIGKSTFGNFAECAAHGWERLESDLWISDGFGIIRILNECAKNSWLRGEDTLALTRATSRSGLYSGGMVANWLSVVSIFQLMGKRELGGHCFQTLELKRRSTYRSVGWLRVLSPFVWTSWEQQRRGGCSCVGLAPAGRVCIERSWQTKLRR